MATVRFSKDLQDAIVKNAENMFNLPRDADSNVSVTREGTKLAVLPK